MFNVRRLLVLVLALAFVLGGVAPFAQPASAGCEAQVSTLWAGKTINVGTVTVWNDDSNLYVKYDTKGDWYLTQVHLYVHCDEPTERLTPGQALYKAEGLNTQSYQLTVPLSEIGDSCNDCGSTVHLQAHAAVLQIVNGQVVQEETAYGGTIIDPVTGSWYGNISYTICCEEPTPTPTPPCQWCSPGYWKNHLDSWTAEEQGTLYSSVFGAAPSLSPNGVKSNAPTDATLLQVVSNPQWYGGGAANRVANWLSGIHLDANELCSFDGDEPDNYYCPLN